MRVKQLQRGLIIRGVVYFIIALMLSQGYLLLKKQHDTVMEKRNWLKSDIDELSGKLNNLNQKTLEFVEAVNVWEELPDSYKALQGMRLNEAKEVFDALKQKYKLSSTNMEFDKPSLITEGPLTSETVHAYSSQVTLSFSGISDEYLLGFVKELAETFPGYVHIKSLNIARKADVTKTALRDISFGTFPALVDGKLVFLWYDLKYGTTEETPQQ